MVVSIITRRKVTSRPRDTTVITSTSRNTVIKTVKPQGISGRNQIITDETRRDETYLYVIVKYIWFIFYIWFISSRISWMNRSTVMVLNSVSHVTLSLSERIMAIYNNDFILSVERESWCKESFFFASFFILIYTESTSYLIRYIKGVGI